MLKKFFDFCLNHYFKICFFLALTAIILMFVGLYLIFFISPNDYFQGELVRILYIHVPCAWLSMFFFFLVTLFSVFFLIYKINFLDILAKSCCFTSIYLTLTTLITGSIWGYPTWGTWWIWDARLTSMLILFFCQLLYFMIRNLFTNKIRGAKTAAAFASLSCLNIPIIKFSVYLWSTLHQKNTFFTLSGPKIHSDMLPSFITMLLSVLFIAKLIILINMKLEIMRRKERFFAE